MRAEKRLYLGECMTLRTKSKVLSTQKKEVFTFINDKEPNFKTHSPGSHLLHRSVHQEKRANELQLKARRAAGSRPLTSTAHYTIFANITAKQKNCYTLPFLNRLRRPVGSIRAFNLRPFDFKTITPLALPIAYLLQLAL